LTIFMSVLSNSYMVYGHLFRMGRRNYNLPLFPRQEGKKPATEAQRACLMLRAPSSDARLLTNHRQDLGLLRVKVKCLHSFIDKADP
jgi:hypothetical protein